MRAIRPQRLLKEQKHELWHHDDPGHSEQDRTSECGQSQAAFRRSAPGMKCVCQAHRHAESEDARSDQLAGYSSKFEAEQEDAYNWESEQREGTLAGRRCTAGEKASNNPAKAG